MLQVATTVVYGGFCTILSGFRKVCEGARGFRASGLRLGSLSLSLYALAPFKGS